MAIIENFDSLTNGDLNGQNSWSGSTNFDVQDTIYQAGSKAVKNSDTSGTYYEISKSITAQDETTFTFYARKADDAGTTAMLLLLDDTVPAFRIQIYLNSDIQFVGASVKTIKSSFKGDTWYKCDIEIRSSDGYGRGRVDDGTWSDWIAPTNTYTSIDKITLKAKGVAYFDEISYSSSDITLAVDTMALAFTYADVTLKKAIKLVVDTMALSFTFADVIFNNALTLIVDKMALSLTYADVTLKKAVKLVVDTMSLVLDFKNVILKKIGWNNDTKPSDTWTNDDK